MRPTPKSRTRTTLCDACRWAFLRRYHRARGREVRLQPCPWLGDAQRVHWAWLTLKGKYDRTAMQRLWRPVLQPTAVFFTDPTNLACTCAEEGKDAAPTRKAYGRQFTTARTRAAVALVDGL